MKIAILSKSPRCYSTRRLREAAESGGHRVKVLNTLRFAIGLEHQEPALYFRDKLLSHYDAVIPRIGASITYFGTAVVRQFEQMGVYCLNSSRGIVLSRDKLRSLQILSRHDIGIPSTTFVRDRRDVMSAIDRVGGAPVIIKLLEGTQGAALGWYELHLWGIGFLLGGGCVGVRLGVGAGVRRAGLAWRFLDVVGGRVGFFNPTLGY